MIASTRRRWNTTTPTTRAKAVCPRCNGFLFAEPDGPTCIVCGGIVIDARIAVALLKDEQAATTAGYRKRRPTMHGVAI